MGLTLDQNRNDRIERHVGRCGVDCRNLEIVSCPASGAVAVKLWVLPPPGGCLTLQLEDGQLTGICVGVRMGAPGPPVDRF